MHIKKEVEVNSYLFSWLIPWHGSTRQLRKPCLLKSSSIYLRLYHQISVLSRRRNGYSAVFFSFCVSCPTQPGRGLVQPLDFMPSLKIQEKYYYFKLKTRNPKPETQNQPMPPANSKPMTPSGLSGRREATAK